MRGDLIIRKVKTGSGATAVQVVRYKSKRRIVVKHIGSSHNESELGRLLAEAERYVERHCAQPSLFASPHATVGTFDLRRATLLGVTCKKRDLI